MPKKPGGVPTIDKIYDFLFELGPVNKDEILFRKIKFDVEWGRNYLTIGLDDPGNATALKTFKNGIFKEVTSQFDNIKVINDPRNHTDDDGNSLKGLKVLVFGGGRFYVDFNVDQSKIQFKGAIPAYVHEEGTTYMLNAALQDDVKFTDFKKGKEKHILADGQPVELSQVYKDLMKLFGPKYNFRLPQWIWTFYQQQKEWLDKYSHRQWEPFMYGPEDFVKYFEKHMKEMKRASGVDAGDYTTWNPSDIWAVRGMTKVKADIDRQLKRGSLIEMNNILINLLEDEELVGISLKMVNQGANAELHLHNVETSPILKNLESFSKIEEYTMKDIDFRYNNIWEGETSYMPTNVYIGPGKKYAINIQRAGNRIGFDTQIKGAAAQGGQTPIDMVVDILKGTGFKKEQDTYPQTPDELNEESDKWKKMYEFLTKRKEGTGSLTWSKFQVYWEKMYNKNKRNAIIRLMYIQFWYAALSNFSNENTTFAGYKKSAEFWTDLLYTGMKIQPNREFAPHAKIS